MAKTLEAGDILPGAQLEPVGDGPPVRVGSNRQESQVLIVTHGDPCDECAEYVRSFGELADVMRKQKATIVAIMGEAWKDEGGSFPVKAVVGDGPIVWRLAPDKTPVVAVADRYGQIFRRVDAGDDHAFPEQDEIAGTLLDIAIRCPECGVPDVPGVDVLPEEGAQSGGMSLGRG